MTLVTLALVLASAALHATWNLWAKQIGEKIPAAAMAWLLTSLSALIYAPVALYFIFSGPHPPAAVLPWIAGSSVIHVAYFILLLRGYRAGDLSFVYPIARGTGPVLAALGAIAWLGEKVTAASVAGVVLVVLGIFTLMTGPRPGHGKPRRWALAYGAAVGIAIAAYTLWDGSAVKRFALAPLVYYWGGELLRVPLYAPLALGRGVDFAGFWKAHRARILGIAILSPFSYILMLIALRIGAVSHVAPAREVSILFGAYLGGRVLGEGHRTRRLIAAAAFAAGVIALTLA